MSRLSHSGCAGLRSVARHCVTVVWCALAATAFPGLMCQGDPNSGQPVVDAQLAARVEAASDALVVSDGHEYGPIIDLLEEYYGDEEMTASICGMFAEPTSCLRIAAVNIRTEGSDSQWQQHLCEWERLAWQSVTDDAGDEGHFQDCMAGIPFLAR